MSQLMYEVGGPRQKQSENHMINQPKEAQIGVFSEQIITHSTHKMTQKRKLKPKKSPKYRRIGRYFKSIKQYKKERERRKRVRQLSAERFTYPQIAEKLGVSEKTVYRDMKKIWPYILGQARRQWRQFDEERQREFHEKMDGMTVWQQLDFLHERMMRRRTLFENRHYDGHYTILLLDLTDTDKYGIPKLTQLPRQTKGATLAYPYKVRVRVRGHYEGHIFEADIGGFDITQTTKSFW